MLRAAIVKSLLVAGVFGVAVFCFKEELFAVILAPKNADFITYRLLYSLSGLVTEDGTPDFLVKLINTGLAEQFIIDCFKEGYVDTDGTRIVSMLPPVSRFAPSNAYELMKSRVIERFRQYFDRFVGM